MRRGLFIAIEGTDGSGKATQTALLARALRRQGKRVHSIAFPQHGRPSAAPVDAYLNGDFGTPKEFGIYQAAVLYAVDRAAAKKDMAAWLKHGDVVIADRYIASNWAFGGAQLPTPAARKKYWRWDAKLEFGFFGIPKPDVTIALAVDPVMAQKLILKKKARAYLKGKKRDQYERNIRLQHRVLATYRELSTFDRSIHIIECIEHNALLSKLDVHHRIMDVITKKV
jgi:dTMP kinase